MWRKICLVCRRCLFRVVRRSAPLSAPATRWRRYGAMRGRAEMRRAQALHTSAKVTHVGPAFVACSAACSKTSLIRRSNHKESDHAHRGAWRGYNLLAEWWEGSVVFAVVHQSAVEPLRGRLPGSRRVPSSLCLPATPWFRPAHGSVVLPYQRAVRVPSAYHARYHHRWIIQEAGLPPSRACPPHLPHLLLPFPAVLFHLLHAHAHQRPASPHVGKRARRGGATRLLRCAVERQGSVCPASPLSRWGRGSGR